MLIFPMQVSADGQRLLILSLVFNSAYTKKLFAADEGTASIRRCLNKEE
jgi:hypothetical protein